MKIAVTGASGFVGRAVVERLSSQGHEVVAVVRRPPEPPLAARAQIAVMHSGQPNALTAALEGAEVLLHLAGRAHQSGQGIEALRGFERDNQGLSAVVAQAAVQAGVRRWIYMSSAKVYANTSPLLPDGRIRAYTELDAVAPADAYGNSKLATEVVLADLATQADCELCILRPPLIIGRGAKGNLASLRRLLSLGLPLPLAGLSNRRSLQSLTGLTQLLERLACHPGRLPPILNVSDLCCSTPEILQGLASGDGRKLRLFTLPEGLLLGVLKRLGGAGMVERLAASLVLDTTRLIQFIPDWPLNPQPDQAFAEVWSAVSNAA